MPSIFNYVCAALQLWRLDCLACMKIALRQGSLRTVISSTHYGHMLRLLAIYEMDLELAWKLQLMMLGVQGSTEGVGGWLIIKGNLHLLLPL